MDIWDVHYRSTNGEDSLDVGAFHVREGEDQGPGSFHHAFADKSFAGMLCSSPSKSVSLLVL